MELEELMRLMVLTVMGNMVIQVKTSEFPV